MALKIKECPEYKQMNNSEYWLGVMTGLNTAKDKAFSKFMALKEESDDEDYYDFDDR